VLGAYAATAQIASLVHFVPSVVASVHVPRIAAAQSSPAGLASARETLSREMRVLVALLGACALALIVAGHYSTLWPSLDVPGQAGTIAALLAAYTVLALVIVDYTMLLGTARTRAIGTAGLLGSVFACGMLIVGSVSESLLVVATSRLVYALVWAAGLRRQSRHTRPGHAPA
jgi:O-antigen/teichoic acid export membrane protein